MAQTATITSGHTLPTYHQVPETKYELNWADLVTLDLSKFNSPGGKEALAKQLFDAVQNIGVCSWSIYANLFLFDNLITGFFYVINFGLSQEQVDRQFAIGKEFFSLPAEEKLAFRADLENGGYNGYKPRGIREILPGKFDNTEIYNIPKFIPEFKRPHPEIINEHWQEIQNFSHQIYSQVIRKLLVLFAMVLELPEEYFLEHHQYDDISDCHLRYMKYHRRTPEENQELNNVWVKGHTDFGSLTLLFRQPVASLQVRTPEGEWKYVKPYPESITVNLADTLQFMTNGFLKSSIHRVVAPPEDQAQYDRYGVLYFVRPKDDLELVPVKSKVLERLGYDKVTDNSAVGVTAGEWVKARVKNNVAKTPAGKVGEDAEQKIIGNVKAVYYD